MCQGPGVLWCSGCQGPWVRWCSAVDNNFNCLGVKIRGFCCVRGIELWGSSGCQGPGDLSGGSVVFGVSMSVAFTITIGRVAAHALGSPRQPDGGLGPGAGVPRPDRAGAAAVLLGLVVDDLPGGGLQKRCEAPAAGGCSGPSLKLTCIDHLHHCGRSQRLRRCMSCRFMSCHSVSSRRL